MFFPPPSQFAGFRFTSGGNSLVFIDSSSLRRTGTGGSGTGTTTTVAATVEPPVTMSTTAACLARAFAIVIRQIADLFRTLQDYNTTAPPLATVLNVTQQDVNNLQVSFIGWRGCVTRVVAQIIKRNGVGHLPVSRRT